MQFKVGYWLQITDLCGITCFNSSLSFMYFSAVWLAFSACAWRAAVVPDADASWLIRVISRFITLQKHTKVRGKPGSKSRCCIRAQTHSHRKTAKPEMYRFLWALKSFMCKWSNIFGCSLASAPCSLDEYFLTSRTASLKTKEKEIPHKSKSSLKNTDRDDCLLTEEENNEYYDHGEKHFIPESWHPTPDPQMENALPSAQTFEVTSLWCTT